MRSRTRGGALLSALLLSGCAASPAAPERERRVLELGAQLVRLTSGGAVPARAVVPRGRLVLFFNEREDGPAAVVIHGHPAGLDPAHGWGLGTSASSTFLRVPVGAGEMAALSCDVPGEYTAQVHPADGPWTALTIVVD